MGLVPGKRQVPNLQRERVVAPVAVVDGALSGLADDRPLVLKVTIQGVAGLEVAASSTDATRSGERIGMM